MTLLRAGCPAQFRGLPELALVVTAIMVGAGKPVVPGGDHYYSWLWRTASSTICERLGGAAAPDRPCRPGLSCNETQSETIFPVMVITAGRSGARTSRRNRRNRS